MNTRYPCLELVGAESRFTLELLFKLFETLETRAGILMGFAGAVTAFGPGDSLPAAFGRILALSAAVVATITLWIRGFPGPDPDRLQATRARIRRSSVSP